MFGETKCKISSIDIPSGWNVNLGNDTNLFNPHLLISLCLPKKCALNYKGIHYIGGRFMPKSLGDKYGVIMPKFKEFDHFLKMN